MTGNTALAVTIAVAVVLSALAPLGVVGAQSDAHDDLSLVVADDGLVSVTANESPVENATVVVSVDGTEPYEGTGEYATDADGVVELSSPDEPVTVSITVSTDVDSVDTKTTLVAIDEDGEEADTGTDGNGADTGNESADDSLGGLVSSFVHEHDSSVPFGHLVSSFVHEHNAGNAPDTADRPGSVPDHVGQPGTASDHVDRPNGSDTTDQSGTDTASDRSSPTEDDGSDDSSSGPPSHAGPP
ncbi:hypothetical protein AB7C87_08325 [Natrarchaeobius sp. A-rgal3]|uniref:hypothetical protein n=1 Tax=Natrarchaeobius versutus TaxID=1679078 RepID=UPI0035109F0D